MKSFKWGRKKGQEASSPSSGNESPLSLSAPGTSNSLIKSFVPPDNVPRVGVRRPPPPPPRTSPSLEDFRAPESPRSEKSYGSSIETDELESEDEEKEIEGRERSSSLPNGKRSNSGMQTSGALHHVVYNQLWRTRPQLERRCRLLRTKSPKGDYVLKIIFSDPVSIVKEFKFSPYTLVGDVVKKLKRFKKTTTQDHMGLYLPQEGIWMEDSLMLYQYDLQHTHTLEFKGKPPREDPILNQIYLKIIIDGMDMVKVFVFGSANVTVNEVIAEVNKKMMASEEGFQKLARQNFGLYLYNDVEGLWLEGAKSLSFYNIKSMDLLGFRKEPTYVLGNTKKDECRLELVYNTTVKDAINHVCQYMPPKIVLSQPSNVLTLWTKTENRRMNDDDPLWVYDIAEGDVLVLKEGPEGGAALDTKAVRDILIISVSEPPSALLAQKESFDWGAKASFDHIKFSKLEGEVMLQVYPGAYWKDPCKRKDKVHEGDLVASNYRVVFVSKDGDPLMLETDRVFSIPLATIAKVDVGKKKDMEGKKQYLLELTCKDFRSVTFYFHDKRIRNGVNLTLNERGLAFPGNVERLFAFFYKPDRYSGGAADAGTELDGVSTDNGVGSESPEAFSEIDGDVTDDSPSSRLSDGWHMYDPTQEFARQGVPNSKWRVTEINSNYEFCESYPHFLVVPMAISDEELKEVFAFRSKGRIPALCFRYATTDTTLCRCSQPLAGITKNRSKADEAIFRAILAASPRSSKSEPVMYIMDARPRTNALANAAKGGGVENINGYPNCKFDYLGIPNIHEIRNSHTRLLALCASTRDNEGPNWLSALESTRWFEHIRTIIAGAVRVAKLMEKQKASVMLHCSDGWDRTAQLSSLVSIFLDPYYRTIKGFEVLIEKEWLSFGHKFSTRFGHGDRNHQDSQRSPIFLQFLDCVYQILQMHLCSFEFNEKFLTLIMDSVHNCKYGTFLCDTEKQRRDLRLKERTVSLWSYANEIKQELTNPFYFPGSGVLLPHVSVENFVLWKGYYLRWHRERREEFITPSLRMLQVNSVVEGMKEHVRFLEEELKRLKDKDNK